MLETHIPEAVARELRRDGIDSIALGSWRGGRFRRVPDGELLELARVESAVIVTYDCQTFPGLLGAWAAAGRSHAGVVLVDERTVRSDDVGGLLRSLRAFVARYGQEDWEDRVLFLERA